jgi:hypothetical protein
MASVVGPGRPIHVVVDATRDDAIERLAAIHHR